MIKTVVVLNENLEGKNMFQMKTNEQLKAGDIFTHEKLEGTHIIKFLDHATIQVLPFNDLGLVQNKDGSWEIDNTLL